MTSYLDIIDLPLQATTSSGRVRQKVLQELEWMPTPTTNVSYVSSVRVLIVADRETARLMASRVAEKLVCYFAIPGDKSAVEDAKSWQVSGLALTGYLGRFNATMTNIDPGEDGKSADLGYRMGIGNGLFDHVIDCSNTPLLDAEITPPGYYYVAGNEQAVDDAIEQIPQLIGEFDKPKFFDYNPTICAHSRSGIAGCSRCIDACPTDAIISIGEQIEVNAHLCQGGGTCTSSCPSGAITYLYPEVEEQLEFVRQLLRQLRQENHNHGVNLLIYDSEHGAEIMAKGASTLPEYVIPLAVEEIGSVGVDLLAAAMAYGANQIHMLAPANVTDKVRQCIERDLALINAVIQGLNLEGHSAEMISDPVALSNLSEPEPLDQAATFAAIGKKRSVIRQAFSFFYDNAGTSSAILALPEGSIFGDLEFNHDTCTLCMGCVSVCPASALEAGGESPGLKFIEANCLQCGICTRACPESALNLAPRYNFDGIKANQSRLLKEEEPFRCISCNKPFATRAMITRMEEKLSGHWMFEKPEAINRLKMCEDCRVADMFDKGDTIIDNK